MRLSSIAALALLAAAGFSGTMSAHAGDARTARGTISGIWTPLENIYPTSLPDIPLLLTDGTVMVHSGCTSDWYKLTPDINGDYAKGSWTQLASMPAGYEPLYFATQVLADGRVIVNGGEYDGCNGQGESANGALYDPQTNTWTHVAPPSGWSSIGNAASVVRADKTYQLANCCTRELALATIDGTNVTWTVLDSNQTGKNDDNINESWTALPDQSLLTVDSQYCVPGDKSCTEIFDINSNTWTDGKPACGQMVLGGLPPTLGVAILLPNGFVYQAGAQNQASGVNCLMDTRNGKWHAAPPFPGKLSGSYAPAAVLPNGNLLIQVSERMHSPSHFFEIAVADAKHVTLTQVAEPSRAFNMKAYDGRMLVLPTGQILWVDSEDQNQRDIEIYTPQGVPQDAWRPVVKKVHTTLSRGSKDNKISGRNFNGFTSGAAYGGVMQMSTNYPLVRITNTATGHVCYARTHDHNRMGISDGSRSVTKFDIPNSCEAGAGTLEVVANGIASKTVTVTLQ